MNIKSTPIVRSIARILVVVILAEILAPVVALSLTGGPTQPEFTSFEPVATTNMVNEFTGQFTYNLPVISIPGPNGSGYAMSLSYHSGVSPEEESSFVGMGWTLNPGSITRNKRGYPDDYKGQSVKYRNRVDKNWTATIQAKPTPEIFSIDGFSLGAQMAVRYNNYKGFSATAGLSLDYKGYASLGYSLDDDGSGSMSFDINPAKLLGDLNQLGKLDENQKKMIASKGRMSVFDNSSHYGIFSFGDAMRSTSINRYEGLSFAIDFNALLTPTFLPAGVNAELMGSYVSQTPLEAEDRPAYGYMYSGEGMPDEAGMDYYLEKEAPYSKRDAYLAIPFSNADNFIVTGEGIGGGFRLYNREAGVFRPNEQSSFTPSIQLGVSPHIGPMNIGPGVNLGVGGHSLSVGEWERQESTHKFAGSSNGDEPYFFRFNNDPGGSIEFDDADHAVRAAFDDFPVEIPGFKAYWPKLRSTSIRSTMNRGRRSGRSSYIGYHTNHEMLLTTNSFDDNGNWRSVRYNAYHQGTELDPLVRRDNLQDQIGEISVFNESGYRYVYGLPVYSRKERNLQYGLRYQNPLIQNEHLAYHSFFSADEAHTIVGEERDAPYASAFLLTDITTPDYLDRTGDGLTADDFGGYTKFSYRSAAGTTDKVAGSSDDWYKWRVPYNGLLYNKNKMSDPRDDMGSVICGEKEIYYIQSVETKTHIAVFVTNKSFTLANRQFSGSGEVRQDGFEAVHDEAEATGDPNATTASTNANKLEKLERIELYAKDSTGNPGKLLQTVHFAYDYSLCRNLPNANSDSGKLTLKKVWFEYNGTVSAKINPYVFGYEYRDHDDYPQSIQDRYHDIVYFGDQWTPAGQFNPENPDYGSFNLDRWGYYQYAGEYRHANHKEWVNQDTAKYSSQFDPAAWQLKWIHLPSGGEIQIQYEQNDYTHVQDRAAMAMVSLKSGADDKYYLQVDSLGITDNSTNPELKKLRALLQSTFVDGGELMHYRFLYSLTTSSPSFNNCGSEYITGYAKVDTVGIDTQGLWVQFTDDGSPVGLPEEECNDFRAEVGNGSFRFGGGCNAPAGMEDGEPLGVFYTVLSQFGGWVAGGFFACSQMDYGNSYVRVPLTRAKLGGGVRVKRLLMYDSGIETGAEMLYGSEYLYHNEDGTSSGVATNEPATGREENALVTYLPKRRDKTAMEWLVSSKDRDVFEGPIGESILPAPSVGYGRVVVKGIHSGRTGAGFVVNEFNTVKDYPFDKAYLDEESGEMLSGRGVDNTTMDQRSDWLVIPAVYVNYQVSNLWLTQGYRFVLNSMHGQPKQILRYGGFYDNRSTWYLSSSQKYTYYQPGEKVPVMYGINDIREEFPGKEMEVVSESRSAEDITMDMSLQVDASIGFVPFIPFIVPTASAFPKSISYSENKLRTFVTTKIVRYPAIVKSMQLYQDGIYHVTENIAFNRETGTPSLSKTYDGYDSLKLSGSPNHHVGTYYSYNLPASWQYAAFGQRAQNERATIRSSDGAVMVSKRIIDSTIYLSLRYYTAGAAASVAGKIIPGDLIRLIKPEENNPGGILIGIYHVKSLDKNRIYLTPVSLEVSKSNQVQEDNLTIEVIKSARTNQLTASAQQITTYGPYPSLQTYRLP